MKLNNSNASLISLNKNINKRNSIRFSNKSIKYGEVARKEVVGKNDKGPVNRFLAKPKSMMIGMD